MSIKLEHVDYVYSPGTAYEKKALSDICLEIPHGEFVGIIGHTGSGKSTLTQHLNGLIRATAGTVYYNGENIYAEGYDMKQLRTQVGLVFQYPEHQLFEVDVLTDVCFGPKNQGLSQEECVKRAQEALRLVGLKEKYWNPPPLSSPAVRSGGRPLRASSPCGRASLSWTSPQPGWIQKDGTISSTRSPGFTGRTGMTVILVSHSMEDIAKYADRIIVMNKGKILYNDAPKQVFAHYQELEKIGLAAPQVTYIMHEIREAGFDVRVTATTVAEAADEILEAVKKRRRGA